MIRGSALTADEVATFASVTRMAFRLVEVGDCGAGPRAVRTKDEPLHKAIARRLERGPTSCRLVAP
jgi:hypothetical protein